MVDLALKRRSVRKEDGGFFTQRDLADAVGCTREWIASIEAGAQPSEKLAKRIGEVLGFDGGEFFT